jgi:hypothetical protein
MALQRQIEELKVRVAFFPFQNSLIELEVILLCIMRDFTLTGSTDMLEEAKRLSWIT